MPSPPLRPLSQPSTFQPPPFQLPAVQPTDPPARVGRIARVRGTVSYHLADADRWDPATPNLPLTTGTAIWAEPTARAELGLGSDRLVLDQSTELNLTRLDDQVAAAALPQGAVYWRVRTLLPGDSAGVQTPRGQVSFARPGRYAITAGTTGTPTTLTVIEGEADLAAPGLAVHVGPEQTATITGDGIQSPFQATLAPAVRDAFLAAILAEEQPPPRAPATPIPEHVARMTGGDILETTGEWADTPEYGPAWFPPVEPGFVPYRDGRWAFVQPWGWTWVDDAPWGFAPSHYGRWAELGPRWCWVPGQPPASRRAFPVYLPAVVGFLAGTAAGALAGARGRVGWVPLGPREPYIPPYRASPGYVRTLNVAHIPAFSGVTTRPGRQPPFANRAATTMVPAAAMAASRTLAGLAQPVPPGAILPGMALRPTPPIRPTHETLGITPPLARQLNLSPTPRSTSPGPAILPPDPRRPTIAAPPRPISPPAVPVPTLRRPGEQPPGTPQSNTPLPTVIRPPLDRPDSTRPNPARPDYARPDYARPDFARPDYARPDLRRPDPTRPNLASPNPSRREGLRPEIQRPEIQRPEFARPNPEPPRATPRPDPRPDPAFTRAPPPISRPEPPPRVPARPIPRHPGTPVPPTPSPRTHLRAPAPEAGSQRRATAPGRPPRPPATPGPAPPRALNPLPGRFSR